MIFFDIETKNFFGDGGSDGPSRLTDLEVSFVGAYDSETGRSMSFWEDDLKDLESVLKNADRVVGYNSWQFDYGVLASYFSVDPHGFPSLDLMLAMKRTVGFRPKLDDLARANVGSGKIGRGSDAGLYWKRGELDKLEKYCLEDVRLTYEVWKRGEETGQLKYYNKRGFLGTTSIDWRSGFVQKIDEMEQGTLL